MSSPTQIGSPSSGILSLTTLPPPTLSFPPSQARFKAEDMNLQFRRTPAPSGLPLFASCAGLVRTAVSYGRLSPWAYPPKVDCDSSPLGFLPDVQGSPCFPMARSHQACFPWFPPVWWGWGAFWLKHVVSFFFGAESRAPPKERHSR